MSNRSPFPTTSPRNSTLLSWLRRRVRVPMTAFLMASFCLWSTQVRGVTGSWVLDNNGNWSNSGNWLGGVIPNGVGDVANFNFNFGANRTITLDVPVTLGGINIGDSLGIQTLTFAGATPLVLDASSGNAFINKFNSTTDIWQVPLTLNDHLNANIYSGILDVTGPTNSQVAIASASSNLIKNGSGTLRLNLDATNFNGNWVMNLGTLNVGGANATSAANLGNGTGGIILNGTGIAALTTFSLNNNGTASNGTITYSGNNDVVLQGAATINVDRNYISGANTGNTIVLDNLAMNGGILSVTSANSYALRFNGTTTLGGDTSVFSVGANATANLPNLTLGGVITDGAGTRALIKEGTGRMVIANAANTYDGVTSVKDGFLQINTGANLGTGKVFVDGGVLVVSSAAQLAAPTISGGLNLVSQIGARNALAAIGNTGFTVDVSNPVNVTVPAFGLVMGIDATTFANNINISQIGGAGNTRVYLANVGGVDRTMTGTITPASDNTIRLASTANNLIIGTANGLGGAGATANLVVGLDLAAPVVASGGTITQGTGGTVSIRNNNPATLGPVTVNRGVTLNVNGTGFTTPIGTGVVTSLGGTISTDATTDVKFGNTDFRLFNGGTLLLDNSAVTTANTDRRLANTTVIGLTSSTLRLQGDGGAATSSAQTVNSVTYAGGNTISVDTDGNTAGRLTTLTIGAGGLNRGTNRGTINVRNTNTTTTSSVIGTSVGTQKLFVTGTAAGPMNAGIVLWGGTNALDPALPTFATYDATHGVSPTAFGVTATTITLLNTSTASTVLDINGLTGTNTMTANVPALAVRLRSTANTQVLANGGFTLNIGASAPVAQGAGLYLAHTTNDTVTHTVNVNFGTNEGLLYAATSGGTAGVIALTGTLSGSNGITRFGDGIVTLGGANTFTGPLTINSGETRLNNVSAGGSVTGVTNDINLWGGSLYLNLATQRYNNNITFFSDARLGNVNVANTGFNNLTVAPRTGSTAPIVLDIRNQAGTNLTFAYGNLTLNGPAQVVATQGIQVNGGISGTGRLEKFGNERLLIGGDSSGYSQPVTVNSGFLDSFNGNSTAKPFGTGAITVNPGGTVRIASPSNINAGQLSIASDVGGISGLGMTFIGDPLTLPAFSVTSSAPWKGYLGVAASGFSTDVNQSTLWGGNVYLGATLGDTGIYTGTLTPTSTSQFLLGTGQGTIRIAKPLTGAGNSAIIGISMTGDVARADQAVNNSGGTVQFDVPMTYGGSTIIQTSAALRISAANATTGIGAITLNGGTLQPDSTVGQLRMVAPLAITNPILMTGDSTVQLQNNQSDVRFLGNLSLGAGSTGVVRQLTVGVDGVNAGNMIMEGGIIDGAGGSGNHLIKAGYGTLFLRGTNTYSGSTNVTGGLLGLNSDADLGNSTQLILSNGGIGVFENSYTSTRNITIPTSAATTGWFDISPGLTFTQAASATYDGVGTLVKRGLGTLVLNGSNSTASVYSMDGIVQINNQAALGDPASVVATGIQFSGDLSPGSGTASRHTGGTIRINDNITTTRGITFNNNGTTAYSGGIDVTGSNVFMVNGAIVQGTEFDFGFKTGTGTLLGAGANTFRQFAFVNGTYQFGTSTPWANSTATATDNTVLEWLGGTIRAVNNTASIALTNQASTTTYNYGGGLHLQMESGAGQSVEFQTDNLSRLNQGTLVIEAVNGTTLGAAGATNAARVIPTNLIYPGVARASAVTNGIFPAHILAADATGVGGFTTNDAVNGIVPYAGAVITSLSGSNPAAIGDITSAQALTGTNSIFSFRTNADVSGGTLVVPSVSSRLMGGIVINGSNTISSNLTFDPTNASTTALTGGSTTANSTTVAVASTTGLVPGMAVTGTNIPAGAVITAVTSATQFTLSVAPTVAGSSLSFTAYEGSQFSGEGLVYVKTGENATINGNIVAGTLTKFGKGSLTLSGGGAVLGDVSVQEGTLKLGATNPLSRMNSELNISGGATLDLNGSRAVVETVGANNRQVQGIDVGGQITNTFSTQSTLLVAGPTNSTFTGTINGNLRLMKAGSSVLTIDGYRVSTPDAGVNTFTGGTDIYGVGTTGGINLQNTTTGLGGGSGSTPGSINLYSGTLGLLYSGNWIGVPTGSSPMYNNLVQKIGSETGNGITVNVRGPGLINVNQVAGAAIGLGNIMQVGDMNLTDTILSTTGANTYRLRVAGTTTLMGAQGAIQTNSGGPSGAVEFTGQIVGAGVLNKLGDGSMAGIVISNSTNSYTGGTNIIGGDIQVTATSGTPLGSGPVRVLPDGTLRLAGNGSVDGSQLTVLSRVNSFGVVGLDDNFNPTVLNSSNFSSAYGTALQLSQPYFTQSLNMSAIGDGRAFLISGLAGEVKYMASTLGSGPADAWNPGVNVYRLAGGVNNLGFDGTNNVLTGNAYLQVGPQRDNVLGAVANTGNSIILRNSNNFSGGTQITKGNGIVIESGGSPGGDSPMGSGSVEVYGTLLAQGNMGSFVNAATGTNNNNITLRPGGLVRIIDSTNLVSGNQGRWGDSVPLDLNGGTFRYDGAANYQSVEAIGAVTARKGSALQVFRSSTASSAQLTVASLARADRGVLALSYNSGFLGINNTTPNSYERIVVTGGVAVAGTTVNGAGVTNPGIAAPWIIDATTHTFVGYNTTGAGTGFQPLITGTPGAGEIKFSSVQDSTAGNITFTTGLTTGLDTVNLANTNGNATRNITLGDNPDVYALRLQTVTAAAANQTSSININTSGSFDTITVRSGGLLFANINNLANTTDTVTVNTKLIFGTAGSPAEALIYTAPATAGTSTNIINGAITANGITKFGTGSLEIRSINPGISGQVMVDAGTLTARVPVSGTGSAVGSVFNGQDLILNGGTTQLVPQLANSAGTLTDIASNVPVAADLGSNVLVRGDATLGNNAGVQYVRINNLTIGNDGASPAMTANSSVTLALQSGIWVSGTTTLTPQSRINASFNGFSQSTFAGPVVGAGGVFEKYGNGVVTMLNGGNTYSGGTTVYASTNATAGGGVASGFRGTGTPFGTGPISVLPGAVLRLADNANIASNAVTMTSDGYGLAAIGIGHSNVLPTITTGAAAPGSIKVQTTGPFAGVLALDYAFYNRTLNPATVPGGDWWIGNSTQATSFYFNSTLGTAASGKYLLGGGGNQGELYFGNVLVSAARQALFENLFTGGTAGQVKVEIGALTGGFAFNSPSYVNGNSAGIGFMTRNVNLAGDVRVNTNSAINLGNNFALGSARLVLNGGNVRVDSTQSITIDNNVLLTGDWSTSGGNDFVINGNVAMHDPAFTGGATRTWNMNGTATNFVGVYGVISGAVGSNIIKTGQQNILFAGNNTYQGYTQIGQAEIIVQGDVAPNISGPLGISDSPIVLASAAANVAGGVGIGGKYSVSRDIILAQATGTGSAAIDARTNERAVVSGAISLISAGVLTVGAASADQTAFRGGMLELSGPISGAGSVIVGTTAASPANAGTVLMSASANGFGTNTFSGGLTLQSARLQIGTDTYYTGPATNPFILSGPLGTGTFTFGAGESNRGGTIEAINGPRTIVNTLGALSTAANTTLSFSGQNALTFVRDLNINSDATMRTRTFNTSNAWAPITFSGNLSSSGAGGATLIKTGNGTLVLTGTNSQANLLTTDVNYGSSVLVDAGILRVNADAALGSTSVATAGGQHLASTPADIRLRSANAVFGGTLQVGSGFTTTRQLIFGTTATSGTTNATIAGIDVAAGQSLVLSTSTALQANSTATVTAATLIKTGPGTLALNGTANTQTALILGGQSQQNPSLGRFSHTGGVVSTTATSGAPFVANAGSNTITINSGTLSLLGGASAQALSVPRVAYGPAAHIALNQGTTSSQLTATDSAFAATMRAGTLNSVTYGTLTINPTTLANLGVTEKFITGAAATALVSPSIVTAPAGAGQDATFLRYDATNGYMPYNSTPVTTLATTSPGVVGDISAGGTTAGAGTIVVSALRTAGNVAPTDGTTLVRMTSGGLILNGATAPVISANLSFNSGSAPVEGLVYVRDGQSGASSITGSIAALDFTKFGPGLLEVGGSSNVLTAGVTRLPVLSVQEGTFRFANAGALFQNGSRGNDAGLFTLNVNESGVFDMNGLTLSIAGIAGNGTITGGGALTVRNGFGVDTSFSGSIGGTTALTKSADGILSLSGFNTYSGGTVIEAGRVFSSTPISINNTSPGLTAAIGQIEVRNLQGLGTGAVTLKGGILSLNVNAPTSEVIDGVDINTFGPGNGYDFTIASTASSNGIALPSNMTSTIYLNNSNTATLTGNLGINSLTIDAPQLNVGGLASNSGNLSLLFVKNATNFSNANTILNVNGGRLFLAGQVNAAGKTITKIGVQDVVLTNTELGAGQNQVGMWKIYGGTVNARVADGGSNPLGVNQLVELNGGTTGTIHLNLNTDGNGTVLSERITTFEDTAVRFGSPLPVTSSEFVSSGASRINVDRILANNSNKTVVLKNVEARGALGSPYVYFTGGNSDSFLIQGTTSFTRDLYLQNDVPITLNGQLTGAGTFVKRFGTTLYVNADNSSSYTGGTIISAAPVIFGSLEGNQITLSDTAKLGAGHVIINPNGQLQINSSGNLQAGQNLYVSSNLDNFGVLRLAANLTLDEVNFRAAGVGGTAATANNYYLTSTNPGGGVLALNTVYNKPLDMRALGDGTWFLGSTNNAVGANGSYDATTLAAGFNNTYRLGGGGATLFFGSNGASNVITNSDPGCVNSLIVGAPMSIQNNGVIGNGSGTVVFLTNQNYKGSTAVNRLSALDFRGTLATSGIETYGSLNAAGEGGTFLTGGTGSNIAVTLRPGSTLRFDNTSAGAMPTTATQGRWEDSAGVTLDNATLRMQGNAAVETSETVGAIVVKGGSFIEVARGATGRGTEIRTPSITRVGSGTATFNTTSEQLGSDERVIITGTAPTVTNGMVAPWMVSNTNTDFLTYNATSGFNRAGFTNVQVGGTTASSLALTNDRVLFNTANTVIGTGFDITTYAARLDVDVTLATASSSTASANRLIIGSGGLITTGTRQINSGLVFGSVGSPAEALIFNAGATSIGDLSNITTSGQIVASSITKSGAGTLVLQADQATFTGNINVQQGALTLTYNPAGAAASIVATPTAKTAGVGGTIFLNGPNVALNLNGGNDAYAAAINTVFNNSVTIGDFNPIVQIVSNRAGGAITNRRNIIGGNFTFGANTAETGQIVRFTGANGMDFQIGDDATADSLTLKGKSVFVIDNGGTAGQPDLTVLAKVTGDGTLVKGRIDTSSDLMSLENVTNLNDWTGGTILAGGTLRVLARANNVAAGASSVLASGGIGGGSVTLMGGTLDLRVNNEIGTAGDADVELTNYGDIGGPDLFVNGSATINVNNITNATAAGTNKQIAMSALNIGSQILTVTGGQGYGLTFTNATTLSGSMFLNNSVDTVFGGDISDGSAGLFINKIGTGTMWVNGAGGSLGGGAYINAGLLDFGDRLTGSATATLGSGTVSGVGNININPGAEIQVRGLGNILTSLGQKVLLTGTAYSPAIFRAATGFTQTQYQDMIGASTGTSNGVTVIAFSGGTLNSNLDQSTIGNGRVFFGNVGDRTYTGAGTGSIIPGLSNLPNSVVGGGSTNRVYRLGGRVTANTLTVDLVGTGNLNDVGGPTDLQIGSLANLGPAANWGAGQVLLTDLNTYTGQTTVVRGSTLRFNTAPTLTAGPLGAPGVGTIHAYGVLRAEGSATFANPGNTANIYNKLVLHPGSELRFQDNDAIVNDRWFNGAGIALNGSMLTVQTSNAAVTTGETVGSVTFDRGSRLQVLTQSTAQVTLNLGGLTRSGRGTMMLVPTASTAAAPIAATRLGTAPGANSERIIVTAGAPSNVAGTNMLPGYFGVQQTLTASVTPDHRFATYNASNGFAAVADAQMVAYSAGLSATSIVNVTAATTLADNPSIFALRVGAFTINSITGANNDSTITFTGSGSDIGGILSNGAATINPNLKFGATGGNEALINTVGGNLTANGFITANGVTKFGANALIVSNDQSDGARGVGNGYNNGWVVNEGTLQLGAFGAAGNAVASNTIVLNGSQIGASQLNLRAQPANTLLNYSYSTGKIIAVDNAVIDWDPGFDDRVHTIADIEIQQAGGNGPVDAQLRVANNRNRSILSAGQLTLSNNAILNVDSTVTASSFYATSNLNTNLTNGVSSGMSVASLSGSSRLTKWGDGYLYLRGDSPGFSGNVVIDEGAIQVNSNGALGSGSITVNRFGVLDVATPNYTPTNSSVTYSEIGAVERWSVDGARTGTINLGPATLQLAVNQTGSATVILNGGSIEGWLRSDDVTENNRNSGVFRNLGENINVNLAGNSFIGTQYYLGANGLDNGKQANDFRPLEEYFGSGVILDIKGKISGSAGLTKVGFDTVILSGTNTYTGGTSINGGKLMLGRTDALAPTGDVITNAAGVLDLNGNNQTVGKLTNTYLIDVPTNGSGFITNSAAGTNTLTVGNGVTTDFTYGGLIQNNVSINKVGSAVMTLLNNNTYRGNTTITGGTLALSLLGGIDDTPWIKIGAGATFDVSLRFSGNTYDSIITGGGTDPAGTTFATVTNAGRISGGIVVGDHVGEVCLVGSMSPGGNSIAGDITTAGNQIGHLYTNADLQLAGAIQGSSPAQATTRLTLQLAGPTTTIYNIGYTGGSITTFIDNLPTTNPAILNGGAGTLANHDYLNVGGTLTLNPNGMIAVTNSPGYNPAFGSIYNLLDWASILTNAFNAGSRFQTGNETSQDLDLPALPSGLFWDSSLFLSRGVIVVVPEPSRVLLMFFGLMSLMWRRRRPGSVA